MAIDLQKQFVGCVLKSQFLGCSRVMTEEQRKKVAELFSADDESVRGSREIVLRKHPLILAVRAPIRRAKRIWSEKTIKFEDGIRLIRRKRISWMREEVAKCQIELKEAAGALAAGWEEIVKNAKERLCDLFEADDYDLDPSDAFALSLSFPAIEPDKAIKELAPEIYEEERVKIARRFQEAAEVAEAAMLEKMHGIITKLADKLGPTAEGERPKKLNQKAVDALVSFGEQFAELSVGSAEDLQKLVARAKSLAEGTDAKLVNAGGDARTTFETTLGEIQAALDKAIELKPRRKIQL